MRILIGEISSYKAIVIAQYVRAHYPEIEIWAYDYKPFIAHIHTRYVSHYILIETPTSPHYIQTLAQCVQQNQIDVFIPVHSDTIGIILAHKHLFGTALDYMGRYEDYLSLHEKDKLMSIARGLGIRVPQEYTSIENARVPFVVKPTNLSSAKGIHYCMVERQRTIIPKSVADTIIQEYIEGVGCGYEVYCCEGEILVEYGHRRLAEWPVTGGSSVLRETFVHPQMRPMAEKILRQIKWSGYVMFEFKLTADNQLVLIEVNPRIWGSINQALKNGCPFIEPIIGKPIVKKPSLKDVRSCLVPQVWLAMFGYLFTGQWHKIADYWAHRGITCKDVSLWKDPKGYMSMIIRKLL